MKAVFKNFMMIITAVAVLFTADLARADMMMISNSSPSIVTDDQVNNVKSYHEWKRAKISDIENKIKSLKDKINSHNLRNIGSAKGQDPNLAKTEFESGLSADLQKQLEQEMLSLSMSRDLTISDYFVGYLTKQTSLELSIREVSARMTPAEVAELMVAFAEHFFQTRPAQAVKSKLRADSGQ